MTYPWLVLIISSVFFQECQVIARERTREAAMAALEAWHRENADYRGEVAIVKVHGVVLFDLGGS